VTARHCGAVLFDFGGVMSRSLFEQVPAIEGAYSLPSGALSAWRGPFDPDVDTVWQDMRAGRISERDYWYTRCAELADIAGVAVTVTLLLERLRGDDPNRIIRPSINRLIRDAKQAGRKIGLLTNELELFHGSGITEKLDILRLFDAIVDASKTEILKPDPEAYRMSLQALGSSADDTVFVDDQIKNIDGAIVAGLQTVHFDILDPESSVAETRRLLGLP